MPCIAANRAEGWLELTAGGVGPGQGGDVAPLVVVVAVVHHVAAPDVPQDAATRERFRHNRELLSHGGGKGELVPV